MKSISPVVGHVALDEVSCSQSRHQGELPRQHGAAHHPGQLTGVLTRLAGAGALFDTEAVRLHLIQYFPALLIETEFTLFIRDLNQQLCRGSERGMMRTKEKNKNNARNKHKCTGREFAECETDGR